MKARDIMTPDVVSVEPDASILHAIRLMLQKRISGLPVIDASGTLVGIITEGDFLRRTEMGTQRHRPRWIEFLMGPGKLSDEYVHASGRKVHEVMTPGAYAVADDAPLEDAVRLMERHHIKRVPVMRGKAVVGIITRTNLLRALVHTSLEPKPAAVDDAAIRQRLLTELNKQPWAPTATIEVAVKNGIVTLVGTILDERERQALLVAAENVPGVKQVEDQLAWVEPVSGMVVEAQPSR